jgi:hypothetical protein
MKPRFKPQYCQKKKGYYEELGAVAHAYNSRYLGGRDGRIMVPRPSQT